MYDHPFVCSLSGVTAPETDIEEARGFGEGTPDGWVKITIQRYFLNPKWGAIQQVKAGLFNQLIEQIPEEDREVAAINVALQIEAQYASLEDQTDKFVQEEEDIFIAPPESDSAIFTEYNKLRALMGLEAEEMPVDGEEQPPILFSISKEGTTDA
tara:strand:+ start:9 stop:473 length:465 start_codon:yes stop_codon:yes gene_type:complete